MSIISWLYCPISAAAKPKSRNPWGHWSTTVKWCLTPNWHKRRANSTLSSINGSANDHRRSNDSFFSSTVTLTTCTWLKGKNSIDYIFDWMNTKKKQRTRMNLREGTYQWVCHRCWKTTFAFRLFLQWRKQCTWWTNLTVSSKIIHDLIARLFTETIARKKIKKSMR